MSLTEFQTYLHEQQPILSAWGTRIVAEINSALIREIGAERFHSFLKIEPVPRLKTVESALGKIARKGYSNPSHDMTDLVGARFVVLIKSDLILIDKIILNSTLWTVSRDRDYTEEIEKAPNIFDYQSIHYVLRANGAIDCNGITVPDKTACEIQIRTLLQHAYAEIVHDNIYKPSGVVPKSSRRLVARSMALMETTDDLFCQTIEELKEANRFRNSWDNFLANLYNSVIKKTDMEPVVDVNYDIIDTYRDIYSDRNQQDLIDFITARSFIAERIIQRRDGNFLFRQPAVLLLYLLASESAHEVERRWPFDSIREQLNFIFSDLGIALDGSIH
jgi:ppGpp synthetase/RelA/SpoT-type nucleotidyltranferase